ncbi:MAG: leucine-rich repeat domain-containing protein, partial [Alkalilacustris sp.]
PLAGLTGLLRLYLNQTAVRDLTPLAGLTGLRTLRLNQTSVQDLTPLAGLTGLRRLYLNQTAVRDLTPLAGLTGLQELILTQTALRDLNLLANLIGLQEITLNKTAVQDLTPLAGLTRLRMLNLNQTAVQDLVPLAGLTRLRTLYLNQTAVRDLTPLAGLTGLQVLGINQTQVRDLSPLTSLTDLRGLHIAQTDVQEFSPLAGLSRLEALALNKTAVRDLAPLAGLVELKWLRVDETYVVDLRPIRELLDPGVGSIGGLWFCDTPAVARDAELLRLSEIEDDAERTRETLAYLKTLPPWPEPYTPAKPGEPEEGERPEREADTPIPTLEAVLRMQSPAGWRFSPEHGALVLYVDERPLSARQAQLARMALERARKLLDTLSGPNTPNAPGLRQEVREEAQRLIAILEDDSRTLSERSLEMWGSLVALGGHLDANDLGRGQGRDALDLLRMESRTALQTLLQIAGNLVRSFPDVQELDDSAAAFQRREVTLEIVRELIDAALRSELVEGRSGGLIQHVLHVADGAGDQAKKAASVSVRGTSNLLKASAVSIAFVGGGVAGGALGKVGEDFADHYELSERAIRFIEATRGVPVDDFLSKLPPDEAALLRTQLDDAVEALEQRKRGQAEPER